MMRKGGTSADPMFRTRVGDWPFLYMVVFGIDVHDVSYPIQDLMNWRGPWVCDFTQRLILEQIPFRLFRLRDSGLLRSSLLEGLLSDAPSS